MKKIILLLACLIIIIAVLLLAARSNQDYKPKSYDHALLYGLKALVNEDDIEVLETIEYSHADFKFWGIPDIN